MWEVVDSIAHYVGMRNLLNHPLTQLIADYLVLLQQLWVLLESPHEAFKSLPTEFVVVWEWWMVFLPGEAYFISFSIKTDLL